eukprot:COSAG02_NODE_26138_length_640_cov_0.467652_1_plen_186_part_10
MVGCGEACHKLGWDHSIVHGGYYTATSNRDKSAHGRVWFCDGLSQNEMLDSKQFLDKCPPAHSAQAHARALWTRGPMRIQVDYGATIHERYWQNDAIVAHLELEATKNSPTALSRNDKHPLLRDAIQNSNGANVNHVKQNRLLEEQLSLEVGSIPRHTKKTSLVTTQDTQDMIEEIKQDGHLWSAL